MPTYYPLQTTVQLLASSLADTTTSVPERRKGPSTTRATERAASIIKRGHVLKESSMPCCDDHSRLRFLGSTVQVPFFLVYAGQELFKAPCEPTVADRAQALLQRLQLTESATRHRRPFQTSLSSISTLTSVDADGLPSETEKQHFGDAVAIPESGFFKSHFATPSQFASNVHRNRSSPSKIHNPPVENLDVLAEQSATPTNEQSVYQGAGATADQGPVLTSQALGLCVSLSEKSFVRSFDKDVMQDVKIDVYMNGEFAECITVSARHAGQNKSKDAQARMFQLISGKRVHRLVERAWVVVPPHQNPDGSMRERNRSKAGLAGPQERWDQINASILEEADKLGFDHRSERTPLGAFLASLAELQMPEAVHGLQKAGGPKFGAIDVVVSVGTGEKLGPEKPYITRPTRPLDKDFEPRHKQNAENVLKDQSQRSTFCSHCHIWFLCNLKALLLSRKSILSSTTLLKYLVTNTAKASAYEGVETAPSQHVSS